MREILFRGKRTDNGEWVEGLPFGSIYGGFFNGAICAIRQTVEKYGDVHDVVIETVGQYTGLTDKNGKKIFEGDIMSGRGDTYKVMFNKGVFWIKNSHYITRLYVAIHIEKIDEVIGTIYDNPELLEEGEQ